MEKLRIRRILVLGGARSGKSALAERITESFGLPKVYLATAQPSDAEMEARIADHKMRRDGGWKTIETPLDAEKALVEASTNSAVLLDCATLWLTHQMLSGADPNVRGARLAEAVAACPGHVVVVSNEVGLGLVPDTPLGRDFRDAQGRLNQRLARVADTVLFVAAGLPLVLKGDLPRGAA